MMIKLFKPIANCVFTAVLSVFLVIILLNIVYSKREDVKLGLLSKLSSINTSLRELFQQGSSRAGELSFAYKSYVSKNNKLT